MQVLEQVFDLGWCDCPASRSSCAHVLALRPVADAPPRAPRGARGVRAVVVPAGAVVPDRLVPELARALRVACQVLSEQDGLPSQGLADLLDAPGAVAMALSGEEILVWRVNLERPGLVQVLYAGLAPLDS